MAHAFWRGCQVCPVCAATTAVSSRLECRLRAQMHTLLCWREAFMARACAGRAYMHAAMDVWSFCHPLLRSWPILDVKEEVLRGHQQNGADPHMSGYLHTLHATYHHLHIMRRPFHEVPVPYLRLCCLLPRRRLPPDYGTSCIITSSS